MRTVCNGQLQRGVQLQFIQRDRQGRVRGHHVLGLLQSIREAVGPGGGTRRRAGARHVPPAAMTSRPQAAGRERGAGLRLAGRGTGRRRVKQRRVKDVAG